MGSASRATNTLVNTILDMAGTVEGLGPVLQNSSSRIQDKIESWLEDNGFGNPFTPANPVQVSGLHYELTDHLGNVRGVVKGALKNGQADIVSLSDYYPFGQVMPGRNYTSEEYRYGAGGQEKVDEISGSGNHYTALFWEMDPRIGRRWNLDPKPNPSISNYAAFANNPVWFTDPLGDTVRTNSEGFQNTTMAMNGILGDKANPIGFNADRGILTYDDKVDISGYSDFQKDVLGRYKELIGNETDVNLKIVDVNEKVYKDQSLNELGAVGLTVRRSQGDKIVGLNVFVAKNPMKSDGTTPEKKEYAGVTNIHEAGGHAYLYLTQPALKTNDHNKLVEDLHKQIFLNYKINGALWYKRSEVPEHPREKE